MRILEVIASVDPRGGGPIEGLLQQARQRELDGLADTHIVTLDDPDAQWVRDCPLKVFPLGLSTSEIGMLSGFAPLRRYGYTPKLVPWLKAHAPDYDAIVVHGIWNYAALGASRALVGSGRAYVVFTHGMLDPWFRRTYPMKHAMKQIFWLFSEGTLLAHARAVFFTTEEERALARGAFWPYRVTERVVAYGTSDIEGDADVQIRAFRAHVSALGERPFFLFLSRIHPKKACDLLIEAFATVAGRHPDLDLVIAGPDQVNWRHELEALAERLGVKGRIHWPGMLAGELKWGAFRACEAFVLPSHQENFGIVVAEAMSAGKPVLISNKVNIWREVLEGKAGLVENDDVRGTICLLNDFLQLSEERKAAMGRAARRVFSERFEMRQVARNILDALKEVAA